MSENTPGESDVVPITEAKKRRGGHRSTAPYEVPPLPESRCLSDAHLQHLYTSAIDKTELDLAQVYSETERVNIVKLLGRDRNIPGGSAIVFPFYEPDADEPYGYRIRPDFPRRGVDSHVVKYDQAAKAQGVGNLVYFPPRARLERRYGDAVTDLYNVEGEKKGLVLDQLGYTCVSLTGVWNWLDGDRDKRSGDELHPLIRKHVTLAGRRCIIVFDSDARTNAQVMKAARRLAGAYYAAGASEVLFICPPDHQPHKGIDDYYAAHGADAVRALLEQATPLSPADPSEIRDRPVTDYVALDDVPVPEGYVVPRGYMIAESGLVTCVTGDRTVEVATAPILISRRYVDGDAGDELVDVCFRRFGKWQTSTVTRRALGDTRAMVAELVPIGAPMHAGHARHLLQWFARMELANESRLQPVTITNRTGWRGVSGFMLDALVTAPDATASQTVLPGRELRRLVTGALRARGTLDEHLTALRAFWTASPYARLMICAALATPLLGPLDERGFALHLFGDTNTGKSSMLKAAASVFGDPSEGGGWCGTWNISPSAAELRATMLTDLPQCFDEVGMASLEHVQKLIYTLVGGEGRARATRDSTMRGVTQWRTVVLSTGEITLADEHMAAGAQARVLDVRVPDFGALQGKYGEIAGLLRACRANAGCLGRDWIESLCAAKPAFWDTIAARLTTLRLGYGKTDNANARQHHYIALLEVVEHLMHQHYGFPVQGMPVLGTLESNDRREVEPAHVTMGRIVSDWIMTREDAFPYAEQQPHGPFVVKHSTGRARFGVRVHAPTGELLEVLIVKTELQKLCREHGHSFHHVMRTWADLGWIESLTDGPKRRLTVLRSQGGGTRQRWVAWRGEPDVETEEK